MNERRNDSRLNCDARKCRLCCMMPQKRVCTGNTVRHHHLYVLSLCRCTHRLDFRFTFSWVLINNYAPAQMVSPRSSKQTSYLLCQPVQYYRRFIVLSFFLSYLLPHSFFTHNSCGMRFYMYTVSAKQLRGVYVLRDTRAFQIAG